MSPFFLRQYVKGHANDVFEPYPQLLTEMALRLPYQVHKYAESNTVQPAFDQVKVMPVTRGFRNHNKCETYIIFLIFLAIVVFLPV